VGEDYVSNAFLVSLCLQAERKGVSASEYGLVFGIFELVSFLSCPILGKYVSSVDMGHCARPQRLHLLEGC
jgi:hypothetical protein